jgi:hypothetical protein
VLYAAKVERWQPRFAGALAPFLADVSASAAEGAGLSLLIAASGETPVSQISHALNPAGLSSLTEVGSHAARYTYAGQN